MFANMYGCTRFGYERMAGRCVASHGWGWVAAAYFVLFAALVVVMTLALLVASAVVATGVVRDRLVAAARIEVTLARVIRKGGIDAEAAVSAVAAVTAPTVPGGGSGQPTAPTELRASWLRRLRVAFRRPLTEADALAYRRSFDALDLDTAAAENSEGDGNGNEGDGGTGHGDDRDCDVGELGQPTTEGNEHDETVEQTAARKLRFRPGHFPGADPFSSVHFKPRRTPTTASRVRIAGIEVTLMHGHGAAGGTLEREELEVALLSANLGPGCAFPTPEEVDFLFNRINSDGSGHVTFLQFLALMTECRLAVDEAAALAALKEAVDAYETVGTRGTGAAAEAAAAAAAASVTVGSGAVGTLFEGSAVAAAANAANAVADTARQREAAAEAVLSAAEAAALRSRGVPLRGLELRAQFDDWVRRSLAERRHMEQWNAERIPFVQWLRTGRGVEDALRRELAEATAASAGKAQADGELMTARAALAATRQELEAERSRAAAQAKELADADAALRAAQDAQRREQSDKKLAQDRSAARNRARRSRDRRRHQHRRGSGSGSEPSEATTDAASARGGPGESDVTDGDSQHSDWGGNSSTNASASESGRNSARRGQRQKQQRVGTIKSSSSGSRQLKQQGSWAHLDFDDDDSGDY